MEEREQLTPDAPHNAERKPPATPVARDAQKGIQANGPMSRARWEHSRANHMRAAGPGCLPKGQAAGTGEAPDPRRPSQRREASPLGTPSCNPHSHTASSQERTL